MAKLQQAHFQIKHLKRPQVAVKAVVQQKLADNEDVRNKVS